LHDAPVVLFGVFGHPWQQQQQPQTPVHASQLEPLKKLQRKFGTVAVAAPAVGARMV
jgi:hypothetical protein